MISQPQTGAGNRPRSRSLALVADIAGVLVALAGAANFLARLLAGLGQPCDFTAYYLAGRAFLLGQDYYRQETLEVLAAAAGLGGELGPFLYPPIFAAAMSPLALLDYTAARLLWLALSLFALGVGFRSLGFAAGLRLGPGWRGPALGFVALFPPVFDDLLKGQVTALLLALLSASFALAGRRPFAAGCLVALAAAAKLSPALLAVQYGLRRQYRALVGALAAGLLLALLSLLLAGLGRHLAYLTQTLPSVGDQVGAPANISLAGLLARLFDPRSLVSPLWPSELLARLATPLALLALGALYFLALRRFEDTPTRDGDAFGLTIVVLLLATPSSQAYTLVLALVPLAVLGARFLRARARDWRLFDLLLLSAALLSIPPDLRLSPALASGLGLPAAPGGGWAVAVSAAPTLGLLLLGALLYRDSSPTAN